jgi:hypothetical protein
MLKPRERFPYVLLPAVLILLAILANPASASGRKPPKDERPVWMGTTHLPASYKATKYTAMPQSAELVAMTAQLQRQYQFSFFRDGWFESGPQELLDSLLPRVDFSSTFEGWAVDGGDWHHFALFDGKRWRLEMLNVLLEDAGFKFDSAHMAQAAQAAVLFAPFGVRLDTVPLRQYPGSYRLLDRTAGFDGVPASGVRGGGIAFPPIEFLSMRPGVRKWGDEGFWLACLVDGARESLFVSFEQDRKTGCAFATSVRGWGDHSFSCSFSRPDLGSGAYKQGPADTPELHALPGLDGQAQRLLRDSFPGSVSYPTSVFSAVGSKRAARLDSMAATLFRGRRYERVWWRAGHPFLDSILPGVEVLRAPTRTTGAADPSGRDEYYVAYRGTLYKFERLNDLFRDARLAADTANWSAIARAAALLAIFGREFVPTEQGLAVRDRPLESLNEWVRSDSGAAAPPDPLLSPPWSTNLNGVVGFPSLTILRAEGSVTGKNPVPGLIRLYCLVDAKRCTLEVVLLRPDAREWRGGAVAEVNLGRTNLGSTQLLRLMNSKWQP